MSIVVQKFGGTSLADVDAIRRCAKRAVDAHRDGQRVLVVVSAMGRTTDDLLALAHTITGDAPRRELDALLATGEQVSAALMAMAAHDLGVPAVSRTATRLGIITEPVHQNARIHSINATDLRRDLDAGRIVVIPGFQGVSAEGHITTLGRGGSDTTAVAIAAAIGGTCEIYTDVDGVYTADPRIVPDATRLPRLSYEEMVELASLGAGVLATRAVMCGQRYGVEIHVRHSATAQEGTMIVPETAEMERVMVVGCALTRDLARITVRDIPNRPGTQSAVFARIEDAGILVDDIMQIEKGDHVDVSFTFEAPHGKALEGAVQSGLADLGAGTLSVESDLAKVSAVGLGMRTHTGVAATMFRALGDAGINIANITTSEIKISCLIPERDAERALRVVHEAFGLGSTTETNLRPAASRA